MKKLTIVALVMMMVLGFFTGCSSNSGNGDGGEKKTILIYATSEDFRIDMCQQMLNEQFPDYDIHVEYMSTGDLSAKLIAEGEDTDADIIYELETAYLEKISDNLATLDVDFDVYDETLVPASHKYVPLIRTSTAIVVNEKMLQEKGIPTPTSYDDLLKPEYKGLISMANPKSSGTGYVFYLSLVNERGLDKALEYFDGLAQNISGAGYTESGSGPIKALSMGEAAIGFCLTWQAVNEINEGADYKILFFEEGSPYNTYSSAVIKKNQDDEAVMEVFDYIVEVITPKDKELYAPEKIYKEQNYHVDNYPENIPYANMDGVTDADVKSKLLDAWKY